MDRDHQELASEKLKTERKMFFLDLKENNRGVYLKITEDVRGNRDTIIIPSENFEEFSDALHNIMEKYSELSK